MNRRLGDVAYLRAGDKGDISNVVVVPRDEAHFEWIGRQLTIESIRTQFAGIVKGDVKVHAVTGIRSYNVVLEQAIDGGVARSLNLDVHGKSWSSLLAQLELNSDPPRGSDDAGGSVEGTSLLADS